MFRNRIMKTSIVRSLAALALLAASLGANAQVVNGDFSAGTSSWNPLGDVSVSAGTLVLTTAFDSGDDLPFNLSGQGAVDVAVLEAVSGVGPYGLDHLGQAAYEGSLAQQTFSVLAGQTLQFDWLFSTRDGLFLDHAFVVIEGRLFTLADSTAVLPSPQIFSYAFGRNGPVTLTFGVADTGDYDGVSTLGIGNVRVSAVPEPAPLMAAFAGAVCLLVLARRRRS